MGEYVEGTFVTMQELAERSGLAYETIRRYRWLGRLPEPVTVLGRPVWPEEAVREWLDGSVEHQP